MLKSIASCARPVLQTFCLSIFFPPSSGSGVSFYPGRHKPAATLQWLEQEDIQRFYPNEAWPNALQSEENSARPDMLALLAMDGDRPAALAVP